MPDCPFRIYSHRACVAGPDSSRENSLASLADAVRQDFDVEFDINFTAEKDRLVVSHNPAEWSPAHDALTFLAHPGAGRLHALNVKNFFTLPAICRALEQAGTQRSFFFFDFELLSDDLRGCRYLMRSLQENGFYIAYRLSEREPFLEQYVKQDHVQRIWLDEFLEPWVTRDRVMALADAGKDIVYVSPDLHGMREPDVLKRRWAQLTEWGVSGICTDYPRLLRCFLEEAND